MKMHIRFRFLTGFAIGYYLGAKAGRERYEKMKHWLDEARHSDAVETAAAKAKAAADEGLAKAKGFVSEHRPGNGNSGAEYSTEPYRDPYSPSK